MSRVIHMFRPPADLHFLELFRHADGEWITDDGEVDIAFAGKAIPNGSKNWFPYAVGYALRSDAEDAPFWVTTMEEVWVGNPHPNSVAMNAAMHFAVERYGCANGRRVKEKR